MIRDRRRQRHWTARSRRRKRRKGMKARRKSRRGEGGQVRNVTDEEEEVQKDIEEGKSTEEKR